MLNAYERLRAKCLAGATRPFRARGTAVKRCPRCLLGECVCICAWRRPMAVGFDIVLLMHRDEVFKPTNSGRLIADLFPRNTYAFEWSRTAPAPALLELLGDDARYPVIAFPADAHTTRTVHRGRTQLPADKKLTLILLDGTWKQARKMFKTSAWLQSLPLLEIDAPTLGNYSVRKAAGTGQLATAEAAAALLFACAETDAAEALADYFAVFNCHYVATRMNTVPQQTIHHQRIAAANLKAQQHDSEAEKADH